MKKRSAAKRLEWVLYLLLALRAYTDTLAHIVGEEWRTAEWVRERVERALNLILEHPGVGAPTARHGERRYPLASIGTSSSIALHRLPCEFA